MAAQDIPTWLNMLRQPAGGFVLPQPIPKLLGQKNVTSQTDTNSDESGNSVVEKELSPATIPNQDYSTILDRLGGLESFDKESNGLQGLQQQWQDLKDRPYKPNLSSLIPFADAGTAALLAKTYQAPETPESREEKLTKLQELIQRRREGEMGSLIKYLHANLIPQQVVGATTITDKTKAADTQSGQATSFVPTKGGGKGADFTKEIKQYTDSTKGIPAVVSALDDLKNEIPPTGPIPGFGGASGIGATARESSGLMGMIGRAVTPRYPAREKLAVLANTISHEEFGSRQTQTELTRLAQELQSHAVGDSKEQSDAFRDALTRFTKKLQSTVSSKQTFLMSKPGLFDAYKRSAQATGGDSLDAKAPIFSAPFAGQATVPAGAPAAVTDEDLMNSPEVQAVLNKRKK